MKRLFLLSIGLLAVMFQAWADRVTPEQAAAVAECFLQSQSPATKASGTLRMAGTWPQGTTKASAQDPSLYLFERDGGGFVIVSGDDVSLPVIGYSTTGCLKLDQMPSNVRHMLDWHASMIAYARNKGQQADAQTKAQWLSADNPGDGVKLETALWDQFAPYNNLAPKLDGKECPIGCVATAIAIIMRYHQWPEKGTGSLPGYYWEPGGMQIEGYALDHTYDWSQMPMKYVKGQYTEEQGAQVAQLMYDLAVMSRMYFEPEGSGAEAQEPLKLATYFGYDKQIRYEDWDYFKIDVWEEMIRTEIDARRPVFYAGYNDDEGHAFVVDGYRGAFFSLNYGWSGYDNGYYLLKPSVPLDEEAYTEFCDWEGMVTHIYPDQGGEVYVTIMDDALVPFPWDFRSNSFPVGNRWLFTYYPEATDIILGYFLYDKDGQYKATATPSFVVSSDYPYIWEQTCNITCAIEEGDCLKLCQFLDGQWVPVIQSGNAYLSFHPGQKIADMISIGYLTEDSDGSGMAAGSFFSLIGDKNLYWEVWSQDLGVLLSTSKTEYDYREYGEGRYEKTALWDWDAEEYRSEFHYPAGTYRIFLRNFDEEMTVYVKL